MLLICIGYFLENINNQYNLYILYYNFLINYQNCTHEIYTYILQDIYIIIINVLFMVSFIYIIIMVFIKKIKTTKEY